MLRRLVRPFAVAASGLMLLFAALVMPLAVAADDPADAPPGVFTNNGCAVGNYSCLSNGGTVCPVGNYSCLYNNGVACNVGNYSCLYNNFGVGPYYGRYPGNFYGYGTLPYVNPYPVAYAPTYLAPTATVASGSVVTLGQTVAFIASGFTAGESVAVTVTAPNGQASSVGSAPAASDGSVTITATFTTAGAWKVVAHGQTSNKDVTTQLTVQ